MTIFRSCVRTEMQFSDWLTAYALVVYEILNKINMRDSFACDVQAERVIKELLNKLNVCVELKNEQRIIPYDINNVITAFFHLTLLQSYAIQ